MSTLILTSFDITHCLSKIWLTIYKENIYVGIHIKIFLLTEITPPSSLRARVISAFWYNLCNSASFPGSSFFCSSTSSIFCSWNSWSSVQVTIVINSRESKNVWSLFKSTGEMNTRNCAFTLCIYTIDLTVNNRNINNHSRSCYVVEHTQFLSFHVKIYTYITYK